MLTKRIVRILTIEIARNTRLTYEKELLNSKKNGHFYKTNHLGFPHALPPYDPSNNVFCIYAHFETKPSATIDLSTSTAITS
jgi:hypothetical protein